MSSTQKIDLFVQEELAEFAPLFAQRFSEQLRRKGKVASGELVNTMASRAIGNREIQAEFLQYGRFVDMGARRGWRKGVYIGTGKPGKAPPKRSVFYSRTKMGLFGQLVSNLSNKYVDVMYEQALAELQAKQGS
jgi:hypothetical protein